LVAALLWLATPLACTGEPDEPVGDDDDDAATFTVVALPDTQIYADDHPELFDAQTTWIADQADALNIAFVTHLGEVVNNGPNERQ